MDKVLYQQNREQGKRGQGETPRLLKWLVVGTGYNRSMDRKFRKRAKFQKALSPFYIALKKRIQARVLARETVAQAQAAARRERRKVAK